MDDKKEAFSPKQQFELESFMLEPTIEKAEALINQDTMSGNPTGNPYYELEEFTLWLGEIEKRKTILIKNLTDPVVEVILAYVTKKVWHTPKILKLITRTYPLNSALLSKYKKKLPATELSRNKHVEGFGGTYEITTFEQAVELAQFLFGRGIFPTRSQTKTHVTFNFKKVEDAMPIQFKYNATKLLMTKSLYNQIQVVRDRFSIGVRPVK